MIRLETLTGEAMRPHLPALARLRGSVFRAWPYLYDALPGSEDEYMAEIPGMAGAALVIAFDGARAVGGSTCFRLDGETPNVQAPFHAAGLDVRRYCYFGESVLEPAYRGQGLGVGFFAAREAHARTLDGVDRATFCRVERPADHPLRPQGDVPLDEFWRRRGFAETALVCTMRWKQIDTDGKVVNTLRFWEKSLA